MEHYLNLSLTDIEGEVWKDISGYEGVYQVSNMGRVKSLDRVVDSSNGKRYHRKGKILKNVIITHGYLSVNLRKKSFRVHRLVAKAFIPNPDNKPVINHIDENKKNNTVNNLEWCTSLENNIHGTRLEKCSLKMKEKELSKHLKEYIDNQNIKVLCITTNMLFDSIKEASEYYNCNRTGISACCKGKFKSCGKLPDGTKLEWKYVKD